MKTLKSRMMIAMGILLIAMSTFSQNQTRENQRPPRGECPNIIGDLTQEQKEEINRIRMEFHNDIQALRKDESLSREEKWTQMETLHQKKMEALSEVLSEEQLEIFLEHQHQFPGRQRGPRQRHRINNPEMHNAVLEKRKEIDTRLTTQEKEIIAGVREQMADKGIQFSERRKNQKPGSGMDSRENREEIRTIFEPLDGIVEKYEEELNAIEAQIREMFPAPGAGEQNNQGYGQHQRKREHRQIHRKHRFLLMDPEKSYFELDGFNPNNQKVILYPNPVSDVLNVEIVLEEDVVATLELIDKRGDVLQSITETGVENELVSHSFDVAALVSGEVYYIRLTSNGNVTVEKFIKL